MSTVTTFDALPSRTPLSQRRTSLRVDPYWGSLWRAGSTESWWSRKDAARLIKSGAMNSVPAPLRVRPADAWARIEDGRGREKAMRLVAALDSWRTMTAEQAEAMTGVSGVDFGGSRPWLSTLWAADLIDFAVIAQGLAVGWSDTPARLMRPGRVGAATKRFEDNLTWPEWVSVTGGYGLEANRFFDRHNALCAETGLRCAEFGNVAMVLGEKLSTTDLLAYSGWNKPTPTTGAAGAADLTLIRPDGARIAVELTASKVGGWIQEKVDRHCEILHRNPMNESGLAVLFVVAPHQDAPASEVTSTLNAVKKAIAQGVRNYPGTADSPTAERIGIASWAHWFPGAHQVVSDFARLPVDRPTGRGYLMGGDDRLWERAYMLDPADLPFAPQDPEAATAIIRNASGLRGVTEFLRKPDERPELWKVSMQNAGLGTLPVVSGAHTSTAQPVSTLRF